MKVSVQFYLNRSCRRKNGLIPVFAGIHRLGTRIRSAGLLFVEEKAWDARRQQVAARGGSFIGNCPVTAQEANLRLSEAATAVLRLHLDRETVPGREEVLNTLYKSFGGGRLKPSVTAVEALEAMLGQYAKDGKATEPYLRLKTHLVAYEIFRGPAPLGTFDVARFLDFIRDAGTGSEPEAAAYLKGGFRRPRPKHRGGMAAFDQLLRVYSSWCVANKLVAADFMKGVPRVKRIELDPIALTREELAALAAVGLANDTDKKVRDLFVLQCDLGCRMSDLTRITAGHLQGGTFDYVPAKTAGVQRKVASVPLTKRATALIEAGAYKYAAEVNRTKYNERIKRIAKQAGLDRLVVTYRDDKETILPLWQVIASHTARRTFVSTLVNAGVPQKVIESMDGHAPGSKAFARYYTVEQRTREEAIKRLEE